MRELAFRNVHTIDAVSKAKGAPISLRLGMTVNQYTVTNVENRNQNAKVEVNLFIMNAQENVDLRKL